VLGTYLTPPTTLLARFAEELRRAVALLVPHERIAHAKVAKVGKGIEEVQKCEGENVGKWFQSW
jgi:hypothetical protein